MDDELRRKCIAYVNDLLHQDDGHTHEELVERVTEEFDISLDEADDVVDDCTSAMDDLDLEDDLEW